MKFNASRSIALPMAVVLLPLSGSLEAQELPQLAMEEVRVWGERERGPQTQRNNPSHVTLPEDLTSINISTTEDLVKHAPSLVVRRRFIGDANGTLGIRGSNMFQTARSMVFADGVPLHYFLESRWNGSPRWTLVSASEVAQVEVLYGPFSAEYSGNAMGGVVNIETAIPQQREFHLDGSVFSQSFDAYGFDDRVSGYKGFVSYGDRIGNLSLYLAYNHLDNQSQPQTFYYGAASDNDTPTPVTGAIAGDDQTGQSRWYFGDSGRVDTRTDNLKLKVGYDWDSWSALLNLAHEDRDSTTDQPNTYLRTPEGNPFWGGAAQQSANQFFVPPQRFNISYLQRESLSAGLRLRGTLTEQLALETNLSRFEILKDETRSSAVHPDHPDYSSQGQVTGYDDTGWDTADIKLTAELGGSDQFTLTVGARYEAYRLNLHVHQSEDYQSGHKGPYISQSGGETAIHALFTQADWQISPRWDLSVGGRYEDWRSRDGYFSEPQGSQPQANGNGLEPVSLPESDRRRFSPKFSMGYEPHRDWQLRYSAAKAYRFPIVEELFSQYQAYNAVSHANPELRPEDGTHHNLSIERLLAQGSVTLNLFQESINDVIESQTTTLPGGGSLRTFVPVDQVDTYGVELAAQLRDFLWRNLDLRFNLTYTHAEIIRNEVDPSIEGNQFPRMPKWRGNLITTYHLSERWNLGGNLQYSSNSFGQLDNSDIASGVYGAQDSQTLVGLKSGYQLTSRLNISAGVDNLLDERAYVAHPWPGRTLYLNFSYRHY